VLDARVAALAAINVAVLELTPRDAKGRMQEGEQAAIDLLAAVRAAEREPDVDGRRPLLVAAGAGAGQAALLLRRSPETFAGAVVLQPKERVPGAVEAASLEDLVRAARDKLR
jgi:dienelactone hydrolase